MKRTKQKETKKKVLTIDSKLAKQAREERHNYQSASWKAQTSNGFYNF